MEGIVYAAVNYFMTIMSDLNGYLPSIYKATPYRWQVANLYLKREEDMKTLAAQIPHSTKELLNKP